MRDVNDPFFVFYPAQGRPAAPALADAQRAIRILRAKAGAYRVDPKRIGIIGFSAGANLTAAAGWGLRATRGATLRRNGSGSSSDAEAAPDLI